MVNVGDRVRIKKSVMVYNHPEHRNQPFDMEGQEGDVLELVREWHGRPVSANLPVLVKFSNKYKAHFHENEVEVI